MKTFSAQRFRELCDEVDAAMDRLSKCSPALLKARLASLKNIIPKWDDEKLSWHLCIAECLEKEEAIPFAARRGALGELIRTNQQPDYIVKTEHGAAIHPAMYYAAAVAEMITKDDAWEFDNGSLIAALKFWIYKEGDN